MKKMFILLIISLILTDLTAQSIIINKQVKDFPDVYDLSTPLNAGVTLTYFSINGIENRWDEVNVKRYPEPHRKEIFSNRVVDKDVKERLLNDTIKEVLVYLDSVACMIIKIGNSNRYRIWNLILDDGKWLNFGENSGGLTLEGWRKHFYTHAPTWQGMVRRTAELRSTSIDTLTFVDYVKQHGTEPKEFLLEMLAKYPLVIYGEVHYRKVSWDLLSNILSDPHFPETVGTIFVEMPAYQQAKFDRFYASKELDTNILLDIFRSFQICGWWDRGQYEFLIHVWKLNQALPVDKKIRVVSTDEQPAHKLMKTPDDYEEYGKKSIDRNTRMADVVEYTIKTKTDKRNSLFIIGYGHARKSLVPGTYSSGEEQEPALPAGAQLVQRLSGKNVFIILQHAPMLTNTRGAVALVRYGLFDAVFEIAGNNPVAFKLAGSPFGKEPFDADFETCLDSRMDDYTNNFDAYIFLCPIKNEDDIYVLYELWSDDFIKELKRRAVLADGDANQWLEIEGELTKENIINTFKKDYEGEKRWGYLFE